MKSDFTHRTFKLLLLNISPWFLWCLSVLHSVPVSVPLMEMSPTQPVVEDKSNVTWTCAVHSGTRVHFQWLRDDVALAPSERHRFSRDNATLSISPVRKEDRGRYRCLASNPVSRGRYSTAKELTVYCELVDGVSS